MRNPFARRSVTDLSPPAKFGAFVLLLAWAFVVLFPIYWLFVTSFKTPYQVDKGPFYIPFVDFQPTLDAWRYILVELGNDTLRPYTNTVIVGLSSSVIALILGSFAAYALVRFTYRPRVGMIALGIGSLAFAFVVAALGAPPLIALASAIAIFAILAQTIGRRFTRADGQQRHRLLAHLAADPAADRGGHPAVRPLPAGRPARQHRRPRSSPTSRRTCRSSSG